jgi:hypothetical protein
VDTASSQSSAGTISVNGSVRLGARHPAVAKTAAQHRIIAEITAAAEKSAAEKSGSDSPSSLSAAGADEGGARTGLASTPSGYDTAHDPEYGPAARRCGRGGGGGYRGGGGRGGSGGGGRGGDLAYSQYAQYQPSVATHMQSPVPSQMHAAQQQQQQQLFQQQQFMMMQFQQQQMQQQRQLAAMQMASGALFPGGGGGVSNLHANAAPYYPQSALPISMQHQPPPPFFHAGMQMPYGGAYAMQPLPYPYPQQPYPQQQQQQPLRAPPNLNEDFPSLGGAQRKS